MLLTGEAGRGKNHNVDAACRLLPKEFYFAFEIASGQSLYYMAELDPNFLRHTFAYPNEIEGAEALWEFLRPMLSKGRALKIVTAKDAEGNMTTKEIMVEGPVTIAIPTIRNKTDEQLQTRLLVSELTDYPGRVKEHSRGVTEQLHPKFAQLDFTRERKLWQEALRKLTARRRVVAPVDHPDFALDDDGVSHGARLWANLLGLMATHAWLEQENREVMTLPSGEEAIIATPEDYEVAYTVFSSVCKRSVVNLSDKHRDILNAVYDLSREFPNREGFTMREIGAGAECSPQTVSNHKTFLVTSVKMLRETEHGLALPQGADPSWWQATELTKGLPSPEKAREYWDDPARWAKTPGQAGQEPKNGSIVDTYGEYAVYPPSRQTLDVSNLAETLEEEPGGEIGHVQLVSTIEVDGKNGLGKPDSSDNGRMSSLSSDSSAGEGGEDDPGVEI
jgi:hypothetical protein